MKMPKPNMDPIEKRMLRIRAMSRKSRMQGWNGWLPSALYAEYSALKRLKEQENA